MKRCKRPGHSCIPLACVCFGAGVLLSLVFSLRLVVVLSAFGLILLGCTASGKR
ncbi:hypothetical protein [Angelakisella massiliensis]|uniref:hypothetical protein n=1 Tax=Angelakisella massiliensis TaxID=1871018 RepID=UPI0023A85906|nr:hypothetical protein [Angelakisella massiliensis]